MNKKFYLNGFKAGSAVSLTDRARLEIDNYLTKNNDRAIINCLVYFRTMTVKTQMGNEFKKHDGFVWGKYEAAKVPPPAIFYVSGKKFAVMLNIGSASDPVVIDLVEGEFVPTLS